MDIRALKLSFRGVILNVIWRWLSKCLNNLFTQQVPYQDQFLTECYVKLSLILIATAQLLYRCASMMGSKRTRKWHHTYTNNCLKYVRKRLATHYWFASLRIETFIDEVLYDLHSCLLLPFKAGIKFLLCQFKNTLTWLYVLYNVHSTNANVLYMTGGSTKSRCNT